MIFQDSFRRAVRVYSRGDKPCDKSNDNEVKLIKKGYTALNISRCDKSDIPIFSSYGARTCAVFSMPPKHFGSGPWSPKLMITMFIWYSKPFSTR